LIKTNRNGKIFEIIVPKQWDGITIDELFKNIWRAPKKLKHQLRMDRSVHVNDEPSSFHNRLVENDRVQIPLFMDEEPTIELTKMDIPILYEDDHLLVVNKKAGMSTHPNDATDKDTLLNGVAYYLNSKGEKRNVRHIHRLDKDTTGAVLFGKHSLIVALLDQLLNERKIKRTYVALVHGKLQKNKGTIEEKIGRDRHHATRRRVSPTGQHAITHYEQIQYIKDKHMTQIYCSLDTGRTHQIRVHMSYIGHPLVGDTLYGGKPVLPRPALHAKFLTFQHPLTLETIQAEAPYLDEPPIFQ